MDERLFERLYEILMGKVTKYKNIEHDINHALRDVGLQNFMQSFGSNNSADVFELPIGPEHKGTLTRSVLRPSVSPSSC